MSQALSNLNVALLLQKRQSSATQFWLRKLPSASRSWPGFYEPILTNVQPQDRAWASAMPYSDNAALRIAALRALWQQVHYWPGNTCANPFVEARYVTQLPQALAQLTAVPPLPVPTEMPPSPRVWKLEVPADWQPATTVAGESRWLTATAALWAHEHRHLSLSLPLLPMWREWAGQPTSCSSALGLQLLEDVFWMSLRAPALPPVTRSNCYFLGKRQVVIVDPGCIDAPDYAQDLQALLKICAQRQAQGDQLLAVLITHHHPDHCGAARLLADRFKLAIWAHPITQQKLPHIKIDRYLEDSTVFWLDNTPWCCLLTPGHAQGHLCLWQSERRILLSGDVVLGHGSTLVPPKPAGGMQAYCLSLQRLLALAPSLLLPGHGWPQSEASKVLQRNWRHRQQRNQQILQQLQTPMHVETLLGRVYPMMDAVQLPLARLNLQAHLEALVEQQHVVAQPDQMYVVASGPSISQV